MKNKIDTDESLGYDEQVETMGFHLDTCFGGGDCNCIDDMNPKELTSLHSFLCALEYKVNELLKKYEESENEEE